MTRLIQALLIGILVIGCAPKKGAGVAVDADPGFPQGMSIVLNEVKPQTVPGDHAILSLGGSKIPVKLVSKEANGRLSIDLVSYDVVVDSEAYDVQTDQFGLAKYSLESFEPAITLLKSNIHIGDKWQWSGTVTGGTKHKATAEIVTKSDKVTVGESQTNAIMTEIQLKIDGGAPTPVARRLAFWFVPGKGLLRREMGSGSVREPAP